MSQPTNGHRSQTWTNILKLTVPALGVGAATVTSSQIELARHDERVIKNSERITVLDSRCARDGDVVRSNLLRISVLEQRLIDLLERFRRIEGAAGR